MSSGHLPSGRTLAVGRTSLSWSRTSIGLLAYAALVLHAGLVGARPVLVVGSALLVPAAAAVYLVGRRVRVGDRRRVPLVTAALLLAGLVGVIASVMPAGTPPAG